MKTVINLKTALVRIVLALSILLSTGLMYYVDMVRRDFAVITNPTGPDISVRE
jgi:hypothetical protein